MVWAGYLLIGVVATSVVQLGPRVSLGCACPSTDRLSPGGPRTRALLLRGGCDWLAPQGADRLGWPTGLLVRDERLFHALELNVFAVRGDLPAQVTQCEA